MSSFSRLVQLAVKKKVKNYKTNFITNRIQPWYVKLTQACPAVFSSTEKNHVRRPFPYLADMKGLPPDISISHFNCMSIYCCCLQIVIEFSWVFFSCNCVGCFVSARLTFTSILYPQCIRKIYIIYTSHRKFPSLYCRDS